MAFGEVSVSRDRWLDIGIAQHGARIVEPRDQLRPGVLE
jgi:hypothetical protein